MPLMKVANSPVVANTGVWEEMLLYCDEVVQLKGRFGLRVDVGMKHETVGPLLASEEWYVL